MPRMFHPEHGFHHPFDALDEQRMIRNGWAVEAAAIEPQPQAQEAPDQPAEVKRKRGRPRKAQE
jgi:hypothetical protein